MRQFLHCAAVVSLAALVLVHDADAQRRGGGGSRGGGGFRGGGGGMSRGMARPSVSRPSGGFSRGGISGGNISRPSGGNIRPAINNRPNAGNISNVANRPVANRANVANRPANIRDRDINNINIDNDFNGDWDNRWGGCCYHPIAAGAGVVAGAAIASAAIGSTVYSLPSSCSTTIINDITYEDCSGTWYQPQFSGTTTTYVVVSPP